MLNRAHTTTLLMLAVTALFVALSAGIASKPLHLDNVDFSVAAEQTALTGIPVCYRGEERPRDSALFHPPLYLYSLALWFRVFGASPAQVRIFGMFCALVHGLMVLAIVRTLFGTAVLSRWAPWFSALFLLNPYTLQTAAIADIDSTIYGPLLCAVILAALNLSWRDGVWRTDEPRKREYAIITSLFVLCLAAKLTTVWLSYPFLFFVLMARLGAWRAALATAMVATASIAIFAVSYQMYGLVTRLDVLYSYTFTWMSFTHRGTSSAPGLAARLGDLFRNIRFMGPFMVSWTGLVPWVAAMAALGVATSAGIRTRDRRMQHYALVLGLALVCTAAYCSKLATFGMAPFKYVFVYWGVVLTAPLLLVAGAGAGHWKVPSSTTAWIATFAFVAGTVFSSRLLHDRLILDGFTGPYTLAAVIPAVLLLGGLVLQTRLRSGGGVALFGVALFCGIQFGTAVYQERAPYATTYDYGQTGFAETAAFLEINTTADDILVSMKDIGYATHRRYYENYSALYSGDSSVLRGAIASGRVKYMVFTEGRGQDQLWVNPAFREWVLARSTLVRSFGHYRIYQLTEALNRRRAAECAAAGAGK